MDDSRKDSPPSTGSTRHVNVSRKTAVFASCCLFALSLLAFSRSGFEGLLSRDNGIYLYGGRQLAEGIPPYVSIFDHKGPVPFFLAGAGVALSRFLGADDIYTVRVLWCMIAAATVAAVFLLGLSLFERLDLALISAFLFMTFHDYALQATAGPQAKTPLVLLQVLALWMTVRRRWFWAGVAGCLSAFVWQPSGALPILALLLAWFQSQPDQRRRNLLQVAAGTAVPTVVITVYFMIHHALSPMLEGVFLFNLLRLDRGEALSLPEKLHQVGKAISVGFPQSVIAIYLGLAGMATLFIFRLRFQVLNQRVGSVLFRDRFSIIFLSLGFWLLWSARDFQWSDDFFPFLPYCALGFSWLFITIMDAMVRRFHARVRTELTASSLMCVGFFVIAFATYVGHDGKKGLLEQQRYVEVLDRHFPDGSMKAVSIGAPEFLAIAHLENPNPYVFVVSGIDDQIEAEEPGGLDGWFRSIENYDPNVICLGRTTGVGRKGGELFRQQVVDHLQKRYRQVAMGKWEVWVKKDDDFRFVEPRKQKTKTRTITDFFP